MKFAKIAGLFAAVMAVAAGEAFANQARGHGKVRYEGIRTTPRRARKYPEQSQRQQMHRFRRAQGGPGIEFNPTHGWVPRGMEVGAPL